PSNRTREIFDQQSSLLNQIFEDIFTHSSPQAIEKRISTGLLDTLISAELSAKSINIEFEFGVYSSRLNRITLEKTGKYHDQLMRKGYSFALFPNNMFSTPDYLLLYFPEISRFILFQMWGMLVVSLALVLVIIAAFIYSITTIIRQKKISEMKNDFINNMTHEFKTPISTVSLACQALTDNDVQKSDELYRNYINIISDENKRLGIMAEKILQTAILEKGKLNARMESLNIHEIIAEVIKNIGIQIEIRDGVIGTRLDAEQYVISADRIHISNVIYNLLDNANKYTPRKPLIRVSTENAPGGILILVQDNGIGIPKTYQKKIFEKLFRVPTGDIHNVKGFGLGLSYVKFVVEKHLGTITLESEPNKGSTFRIFLPF
ncbi:MAG TPA: HAMP domain-containing sensor histidine kinase, partial [Bacteroidales bacterium]